MSGHKGAARKFEDDGLDDLLQDLDETDEDAEAQSSRKRKAEAAEWLAGKRRKAVSAGVDERDRRRVDAGGGSSDDSDEDGEDPATSGEDGGLESSLDDGDSSGDDMDEALRHEVPRQRENPYVAPTTESSVKYVPLARRRPAASDDEAVTRLRRQIQGLVNRLSESNMLAILGDIEKFYREHPRHHVTTILVDMFLDRVAIPSTLPDTFLVLDAAFTTAVYRVVGTDFGAYLVQRVVSQLREHHGMAGAANPEQKQPVNLMAFLAQLYIFNTVGSNLIFDFVRLLLRNLSELNTELLLRIIRICGPQLRQDDPLALKDIVALIRPAIAQAGGRRAFRSDELHD